MAIEAGYCITQIASCYNLQSFKESLNVQNCSVLITSDLILHVLLNTLVHSHPHWHSQVYLEVYLAKSWELEDQS